MNNNVNPAAMLCGLFAAVGMIALGILIGAVILRAAVSLANKVLGSSPAGGGYDEFGGPPAEYAGGYGAGYGGYAPRPAIPEPGFGKACGIVVVNALVGGVIGFAVGIGVAAVGVGAGVGQKELELISNLVSIPLGFLIGAGLLTAMLPTTFPRACLVMLFQYLIVFLIALVIGGGVVAMMFALGMMR